VFCLLKNTPHKLFSTLALSSALVHATTWRLRPGDVAGAFDALGDTHLKGELLSHFRWARQRKLW